MDKDILKGIKIGFGIFLFFSFVFGLAFAVGFHTPNEILPGTFLGNYSFNGTTSFNGGNVGIGTDNPSTKLDVNGSIKSSNINIPIFSVYEPDNVLRSYSWQTIFNNALANKTVQDGKIYDCIIISSNPAHYGARRFNVGVDAYNDSHRITNIIDVDSGYLGGCSTSLSSVTTTGFDYLRGTCFQAVWITCNRLN